jgi:hypothetical protein
MAKRKTTNAKKNAIKKSHIRPNDFLRKLGPKPKTEAERKKEAEHQAALEDIFREVE